MSINTLWAAVGLSILWVIAPNRSQADAVMYDGSGFLRGTQSFSESFNLVSAGTLTVTLSNIAWPEKLSSLNFVLSSANGKMGSEMGTGTSTFTITSGGEVFAQWFGTAQGPLDAGVFAINIQFSPAAGGTPVPVPSSIVLLISGLLALWGLGRHHRDSTIRQALPKAQADLQAA
jgi:hypothetical protein